MDKDTYKVIKLRVGAMAMTWAVFRILSITNDDV